MRSPFERARRWLFGWNWRHWLFYVGMPMIIAVYAALNNWAVLQVAGYSGTLLFYLGHAFIPWWTTCAVTWLVMQLLRPWQPPQLLILTLGTVIACFLVLPYSEWLTTRFAAGWLVGDASGLRSSLHIHQQVGFWTFLLRASVIWVAVNLLFDRLLGLPRYRYDAGSAEQRGVAHADGTEPRAPQGSESATEEHTLPRFLQRLPVDVGPADVIAMKAEQHYVKVFTRAKSFMTLYRFSDAVAEMDPESGQQVHRSYWVQNAAIRAIRREARKYYVVLENDLKVPVSAPNRGLIRQLAQKRGIPIYPPL